MSGINWASRSQDDAEIIYTYLHAQDRAYSVAEVLAFVRDHGLCFQTWVDNGKYGADNLEAGSLLERSTRELPLEAQCSIVEARGARSAREFRQFGHFHAPAALLYSASRSSLIKRLHSESIRGQQTETDGCVRRLRDRARAEGRPR